MQSYHLIIIGKVQGVFFRQTAKEIASKYSLTGWIQNNDDGNVEAVICGEENSAKEFIKWSKAGPALASVEKVEVNKIETQSFTDFKIRRK